MYAVEAVAIPGAWKGVQHSVQLMLREHKFEKLVQNLKWDGAATSNILAAHFRAKHASELACFECNLRFGKLEEMWDH